MPNVGSSHRRMTRDLFYWIIIFVLIIDLSRLKFLHNFDSSIIKSSSRLISMENRSSFIENEIADQSILCSEIQFSLHDESFVPSSLIIEAPQNNASSFPRLFSKYSQWQSSSILPRSLSRCEHSLLMNLLRVLDQICRKHQIVYFIIGGTLLGSWRHHDIIPWDDDIDILIPYEEHRRFSRAFEQLNQTLIQLQPVEGKKTMKNYLKLFFRNTPTAGIYSWHFPFIDIFLYQANGTHLWNLKKSNFPMKMSDIFPLVMRPLGSLWVPSPRKPASIVPSNSFHLCEGHFWSHRNDSGQDQTIVKCDRLKRIYPFVQRKNSIEILKLNNVHLHTIMFQ